MLDHMEQEGVNNTCNCNVTAYSGVYDNWNTEGKDRKSTPKPCQCISNKSSRWEVHLWLWTESDDDDLHQLHWLAQVSIVNLIHFDAGV